MKREYDIIVVGGGPGGFCAALGAAERGVSVLLVERYGFLGGMATAGLVNPFMAYQLKGRKLTNSVFNRFIDRMETAGALDESQRVFDDEVMKCLLDEMMQEAGVDLLFHAFFTRAEVDGGRIKAVTVETKSGPVRVEGKVFVDSTGDGDLAARAGAEVEMGRPEDGLCQPMTLCFRAAGVDLDRAGGDWHGLRELRVELTKVYQEAQANAEIDCPREDVLVFRTLRPDVIHFNTTRILGLNATDVGDMTRAEIEGRRQVMALMGLFRKRVPSFQNAYIQKIAPQVGVRESRRVVGSYELGAEDVLEGRKFPDGIARSCYPIDIHNPAGKGTVIRHPPAGDYYEIPYRCLIPESPTNLLIGSRCISSTHEAHSSLRVMPVVASVGEAAGAAAAKAAKDGTGVAELSGEAVRHEVMPTIDIESGDKG